MKTNYIFTTDEFSGSLLLEDKTIDENAILLIADKGNNITRIQLIYPEFVAGTGIIPKVMSPGITISNHPTILLNQFADNTIMIIPVDSPVYSTYTNIKY